MSLFPPADLVGEIFDPPISADKFQLIMRLAYGGTGEVFVARNSNRELTALKILHAHLAIEPKATKAFEEEIKLMRRIDDPIFPAYISHGKLEGRPYLEMELIRGFDLAALMREIKSGGETLGQQAAVSILFPLVMTVERLSVSRGFIHRDLTPHNIIVDFAGRVRIADLGIAREAARESLTKTGEVKGKAAYLSPEQAAGENLTAASDIFSLGATLFEALTGEPLYSIEQGDLWKQALDCNHGAERRLNEDILPELKNLVLVMLSKEPEKRPRAASVLVELEIIARMLGGKADAQTVKLGVWPKAERLYTAFKNKLKPFEEKAEEMGVEAAAAIKNRKLLLIYATLFFGIATFVATLLYKACLP